MTLNPRRIVLFGCSHGRMSQQLLHRAYVGAVLQQPARERIAEPVRRRVKLGQFADALHRAPQVSNDGRGLASTGPEKELGIAGGQAAKLVSHRSGEMDSQRNTRLLRPQRKVVVLSGQSAAAENGGIASPKAGVEQQKNDCPSPAANVAGFGGVVTREPITCGQQLFDFLLGVGHRRARVDARRPNTISGVALDEFAADAPAKEEAQMLQFLSLCARLDLPSRAPLGDVRRGDVSNGHVGERPKGAPVAGDCGCPDVPGPAISEVAFGCFRHSTPAGLRFGLANLDRHDSANSFIPVFCLETAADGSANSHPSVGPNRASAERVVLPLALLRTPLQVPSIGREHGDYRSASVRGFCEIVYTGREPRAKSWFGWRKLVGVGSSGIPALNDLSNMHPHRSLCFPSFSLSLYAAYTALNPKRNPYACDPSTPERQIHVLASPRRSTTLQSLR